MPKECSVCGIKNDGATTVWRVLNTDYFLCGYCQFEFKDAIENYSKEIAYKVLRDEVDEIREMIEDG